MHNMLNFNTVETTDLYCQVISKELHQVQKGPVLKVYILYDCISNSIFEITKL